MDVRQTITDYWDWRSASYTNGASGLRGEERDLWIRALSFYVPSAPRRIVDIGTGRGFLAILLAEFGHTVTAVDISQSMLDKAEEEARRRGVDIAFVRGDAEAPPFPPNSFDVVVNKYLLWTLPQPDKALAAWHTLLRPGGKMITVDGNWFDLSLRARVKRNVKKAVQTVASAGGGEEVFRPGKFTEQYGPLSPLLPLFHEMRPETVRSIVGQAGFCDIEIDPLKEINRYLKSSCSLLLRLLHTGTIFLVSAVSSNNDIR